jgi:gliding motility-associated-like protein
MKFKFSLFLTCTFFINFVFGQSRAQDSLLLTSFYTATAGQTWTDANNWNSGPLNSWKGITLKSDLVWNIILPKNNLKGSITAADFPVGHPLGIVNLSENLIEDIPSGIVADTLIVTQNKLTFQDLYPYKGKTFLSYSNQDSVEMRMTMLGVHRGQLTIQTAIDTSVPNIKYQWYKNGLKLVGDSAASLAFQCVVPTNAGTYTCRITHPDFPLLTVHRRAITLLVTNDSPNPGLNNRVCQSNYTLSGIAPKTGMGTWSKISDAGVISDPLNPNSSVSGMMAGNNTFRWTVTHPNCADEYKDVVIKKDTVGEFPFAGADQVICDTSFIMNATLLNYGTGSWTVVKGTANIIQSTNAKTKLIQIAQGENIFRWSANNGACESFFDEVMITRVMPLTNTYSGRDTALCGTDLFLDAKEVKNVYGSWSLIQGTATIDNAAVGASRIYGLDAGTNTFVWTADNACNQPIKDTVNVIVHPFIHAIPGADTTLFYTPTTPLGLVVSTPATGGTGAYIYEWSPAEYLDSPKKASGDFNPPYLGYYTFQLKVTDIHGCADSAFKTIEVIQAITIEIPTLFTPNHDGNNDILILLGIESYPKSEFVVMDKLGKLVYKQKAYDNTWSGIGNEGAYVGQELPEDTYFYYLDLGLTKSRIQKGFFVIKR